MLPNTLQPSLIVTDPTTQKLADLEARIAKLESALIIGSTGVTLKSGSNISIESSSTVTVKAMSMMVLQASGTLTLKGATIDLN